jgi:peroxiredoxin family protein
MYELGGEQEVKSVRCLKQERRGNVKLMARCNLYMEILGISSSTVY